MDHKNTVLDDISSVIGFTLTMRVAAWFGNTNNLYVPQTVEDGQLLVRLLGRRPAEKLTEAFPGEWLSIPRLTSYEEDERRHRIALLLMRGLSTREVSKVERISERRVQQICRDLEVAGVIPPVGRDTTREWVEANPSTKFAAKMPLEKVEGKSPQKKPPEKVPLKSLSKNAVETQRVLARLCCRGNEPSSTRNACRTVLIRTRMGCRKCSPKPVLCRQTGSCRKTPR